MSTNSSQQQEENGVPLLRDGLPSYISLLDLPMDQPSENIHRKSSRRSTVVLAITRHGYECGVVSMFLLLGEKSPFCVSQNQDPPNPLAFFRKRGQQKIAHEVRVAKIESLLHIGIDAHWQWTATNVPEVIGFTAGRITSHLFPKFLRMDKS